MARTSTVSPADIDAAADLLRALSAPVRFMIVHELQDGERCVHELIDALRRLGRPVSQSLMSQHLRVLRGAGLVTTERRGQEIAYRLVDRHVAAIATGALEHAGEPRTQLAGLAD
ncbi:MAG TPA: metalloregulator ArsR/SmtB family transcription factor [Mycobacteriales bacterium]|nr:metalloregulator ArsR/SmtB family transcription factor [Mycobacteriales bacterium]